MNKKGFTLIELLAVIVVLGVIMTIAGMSVSKIRKDAVKKELEHIENSITKVGESVFSYEMIAGNIDDANSFKNKYNTLNNNDKIQVSLKELQEKQYLKGIDISNDTFKSPDGKTSCSGYLLVTKKDNAPVFKGCITCRDYTTNGCNNSNVPNASLTSSN